MKIRVVTNQDDGFYALLGPYLARREVAKELRGTIWDDDDKEWFVATERGKLLGFGALKGDTLCSTYVLPKHRRRGVYAALLGARLAARAGRELRVTAQDVVVPALSSRGFVALGRRGSFTMMRREAS